MKRLLLLPFVLLVSPFVWLGHILTGGNRAAEGRAIRYIHKHIEYYTRRWQDRVENIGRVTKNGGTNQKFLQALIESLDSLLQRPVRTPLGVMTAADYRRLILLRLERNYYARMIAVETPPAKAEPVQLAGLGQALGQPPAQKPQSDDYRAAWNNLLRAAPPFTEHGTYNHGPVPGKITGQIDQR